MSAENMPHFSIAYTHKGRYIGISHTKIYGPHAFWKYIGLLKASIMCIVRWFHLDEYSISTIH